MSGCLITSKNGYKKISVKDWIALGIVLAYLMLICIGF